MVATNSVQLKKFLDSSQYTEAGIKKYEFIFGKGFISTGGLASTEYISKEYLDNNLKKGGHILDVGCGIGGGCEFLADKYGSSVLGIDLSQNVLSEAQNRYKHRSDLIFECVDCLTATYPPSTFDMIYSRDAILHIKEKSTLFENFMKWLKPGGIILITDYCCGPQESWSEAFKKYVAQREYHLLTVDQYTETITKAGFIDVIGTDCTDLFREILLKEKVKFEEDQSLKKSFLELFSSEELTKLIQGWEEKIERTKQGDQKWGCFFARKQS